jgi:poly(hydroxyalkanoate) granule-associated protein
MEDNANPQTPPPPSQENRLQDELKESAHKIWLAGLGALSAAEEEGTKLFNRLVDRGKDFEAKGKVEVEKVKAKAEEVKAKAEATFEEWSGKLDEKVTATLQRLGVPTRDEIHTLTQKVEDLTAKLEQLKPKA